MADLRVLHRHTLQHVAHERVGVALAAQEHAVAQGRHGERLQVVGQDVVAIVEQRAGLRRAQPRHRRARAGAELHFGMRARGGDDAVGVLGDRLANLHGGGRRAQLQQRFARQHRLQALQLLLRIDAGVELQFVALVGIAELDAHEEAIECCLRHREGAVELDRVARRQHRERLRQLDRATVDRHAPVLHRFEQARQRARAGAVDLVGEHEVGEQWSTHEHELAVVGAPDGGTDDVARHQVVGELDALVLAVERQRQRARQHRLADAGDAFQQHMAAGDDRAQDRLDGAGRQADDVGQVLRDDVAQRSSGRVGGGRHVVLPKRPLRPPAHGALGPVRARRWHRRVVGAG
jgi:hypothetical protein